MKTLIAWFSWSGNTKEIAEKLARKTYGDLFQIERQNPYSTDYHTCAYEEAKEEADKHLRPAINGPLPELTAYDAVMIAFPIWWYTMPAPVIFEQIKGFSYFDCAVFCFLRINPAPAYLPILAVAEPDRSGFAA